MTAELKSCGETVRVGTSRGRYLLLARLVGKKEAKASLRGEPNVLDGRAGAPPASTRAGSQYDEVE